MQIHPLRYRSSFLTSFYVHLFQSRSHMKQHSPIVTSSTIYLLSNITNHETDISATASATTLPCLLLSLLALMMS